MDDAVNLRGIASSSSPTAASVLGIKGSLRFRPHGSSQKAHVVLRRVELDSDSADEGEEKPVIYFSLFAQKRIEVKPGKEILLTLADGPFKDRAIVFEGDVPSASSSSDEEEETQVAEDDDDVMPPEHSIPPKMRKPWLKRFEEPGVVHHGVPQHRSYKTIAIQTDLDVVTPSSPIARPHTEHVERADSEASTPPPSRGLSTLVPPSRSPHRGASIIASQQSALEDDQLSGRDRSLSPMELDSPASSPPQTPSRVSLEPPLIPLEEKPVPALLVKTTPPPAILSRHTYPPPSHVPLPPSSTHVSQRGGDTVPSMALSSAAAAIALNAPALVPPNPPIPAPSAYSNGTRAVDTAKLGSDTPPQASFVPSRSSLPPSQSPPPLPRASSPPPQATVPPPPTAVPTRLAEQPPKPPTPSPAPSTPTLPVAKRETFLKSKPISNPFVSGGFLSDFVSLPSTPPPSLPAAEKKVRFAEYTSPIDFYGLDNGLAVKREQSPHADLPLPSQQLSNAATNGPPKGSTNSLLAGGNSLPICVPSPQPPVLDSPPSWPPFKAQQDWTSTVDMDSDPPFRATPARPTIATVSGKNNYTGALRPPSFVRGSNSTMAIISPASSTAPPPSSPLTPKTPLSYGGSAQSSSGSSHPLPPKPQVPANVSRAPRHVSPLATRASDPRRPSLGSTPASGVKRKVSSPLPDTPVESQTPVKRKPPSYWPTVSPVQSRYVKGEDVGIRGIAFNSTGTLFAVNCRDCTIRIWDNTLHTEIARLPHPTPVVAAVWMEEDVGVLALCENGFIIKWTRPAAHDSWHWGKIAEPNPSERKSDDIPTSMAYVRDRIAVAFPRLGVKVWLLNKGVWQSQRSILRQNVTAIKFVEDGDALLGGTKDGVLWYCQIPNGTLRAYTFFKTTVYHIDVTSSGTHALVAQLGGRTHLVGIRQDDNRGKIEQVYSVKEPSLQGKANYDSGALFTARDSKVIFASVDGYVLLWDKNRAEVICGLDHGEGSIAQAIGSCRGGGFAGLVTGSQDGKLTWWAETADLVDDSPYKRLKTS
ncbi:WD40 repeat-like protein [Artomyces pyxidatus]|uniref:WD40 repeat-like protein n=1 Tax=Artomyces pyxidatus TaxID=48021 RepID=A0ACB8SRC1_9AGAM|nr:WD40 repeat-like protein [Artomyces pyxidatus]